MSGPRTRWMHNQSQSDRFTAPRPGQGWPTRACVRRGVDRCFDVLGTLLGQELAALDRLATRCDYTAGRITSHDPKGSNQNFWVIAPGETRVPVEITGPGSIVHFRDNITSDVPHHLQLHVLRIYWDGEREPSVEVPIGDFFGIGFGFTEKTSSALMNIDQRRGSSTDPRLRGPVARQSVAPLGDLRHLDSSRAGVSSPWSRKSGPVAAHLHRQLAKLPFQVTSAQDRPPGSQPPRETPLPDPRPSSFNGSSALSLPPNQERCWRSLDDH